MQAFAQQKKCGTGQLAETTELEGVKIKAKHGLPASEKDHRRQGADEQADGLTDGQQAIKVPACLPLDCLRLANICAGGCLMRQASTTCPWSFYDVDADDTVAQLAAFDAALTAVALPLLLWHH